MGKPKEQKIEKQAHKPENKSTLERTNETHTEELIFGICSQIGAKKEFVITEIKERIKEYGYQYELIKLSKFIEEDEKVDEGELKLDEEDKTLGYKTYYKKIQKGNKLREKLGKDYLANMAIAKMTNDKKEKFKIKDKKDFNNVESQRICYIIDSIKHKEEYKALKSVYGDLFYQIGVFTPKKERIQNISIPNITVTEAKSLIKIDEYQDLNENGQQVRDVFVESDFFIKVKEDNESAVRRLVCDLGN